MTYRKDIDGLRAIAVLSVLLFHGFPDLVPGGFVGVDVFFVISGFLITSIILRDINQSKFSIFNFYDRRIRRILPALIAVVLVTAAIGWIALVPVLEYKELSQSIASIGLFVSNMFFWYKSDYFAQSSELQPLLHTWSLSVEEQFYFIWPLLLMLLFKFRQRIKPYLVVILLTFMSLIFSQLMISHDSSAAFYWAPSRFWELSAGGLLAFLPAHSPKSPKFLWVVQSIALGGLLACFLIINSGHSFPGLVAFFPVVFSAILIRYGGIEKTPVSGLLQSSPMVFIGKISYSLYLWHWPLLVFARIYYGDLNPQVTISVLLLSGLLSFMSWKFIETPFRKNSDSKGYALSFSFATVSIFMLTTFGYMGHRTWGYPERLDASLGATAKALKNSPHFSCGALMEGVIGSEKPQVALWGDSHAADLCPAMLELSKTTSLSTINFIETSCLPLVFPGNLAYKNRCRSPHNFEKILNNKNINTVVLAGEWPSQQTKGHKDILTAIDYTLTQLIDYKKKVVFVGDVPVYQSNIPVCSLRAKMLRPYGLEVPCNQDWLDPDDQFKKQTYIKNMISKINDRSPGLVVFIDRMSVFCRGSKCESHRNNVPLYRDSNHLTIPGSLLALPMINQSILAPKVL